MRRVDLLQALLIRFVDPQREEQDWNLLASLFYSLTGVLLLANRVEELYYQYLQLHGSRAAMEAACKQYEVELVEKLRQCTTRNNEIPVAQRQTGGRHLSICGSSSKSRVSGGGIPKSFASTGIALSSSHGNIGNAVGEYGSLDSLVIPLPKDGGNDDGCFEGGPDAFNQLTTEQREYWRCLRNEPISPEVLISLLEKFTLLESAGVFLAPVLPSTIMEFNGIRSGSYDTVIMRTLSLMCIKKRVLAYSHEYELHQAEKKSSSFSLSLDGNNASRRQGGRGGMTAATLAEGGSSLTRRKISNRGGDYDNSAVADGMGAIRTLQELEQAIWHIAANSVVFNAPESYYPSTARAFATACSDIIGEYCIQRVLGS